MNKLILFLFLFVIFNNQLFSQNIPVTFPSPEATNLGIIGNLPVSYHTGMVNIAIPLPVGNTKLAIPMSLTYNSSGVLPDLHPGWVGLNWTLNVGGVITRVQKGELDENTYGFFNNPNKLNNSDWSQDENLWKVQSFPYIRIFGGMPECYDTEPDEFIFNVNGIHGKFYMDNNGVFRVASQPNLKIEFDPNTDIGILNNMGTTILGFTLIADDGTKYRFGNNKFNLDYMNTKNLIESNSASAPVGNQLPTSLFTATSWLLSDITYPNQEKISFEYTDNVSDYNGYYLTLSIASGANYVSTDADEIKTLLNGCSQAANGLQWSVTSHKYLKSINAPNYTISFKTSKSIELQSQLDSQSGGNWQQLDTINVISKATGNRQKSFVFRYTNNPSSRLFLQTVSTFDNTSKNSLPPYRFSYNEGNLDAYYTKNRDHWGYYNLNLMENNIPTQVTLDGHSYYWHDREPDFQNILIGTLKQIEYPTGGKVFFEFEPNEYSRYFEADYSKPSTVSTGETIYHPSEDVTASSPLILKYPADIGYTLFPSMKSTNGTIRISPGTYTLSYLSALANNGNPTNDNHAYITYTENVTRVVSQPGKLVPITRSWNYHASSDVTSTLVLTGPADVGYSLYPSMKNSNGYKILQPNIYTLDYLTRLANNGNPTNDTHAYLTYWELTPALKTLGAGLRISKIHYKNSDSEDIYHEFSYCPFNPDSALYSSGILGSKPQYYCSLSTTNTSLLSVSSSQTLTPVRLSQGAPIGYSNVTEKIKDMNGLILGYTTYKYSNFDSNPDLPSVNVLTSLSELLGKQNSKEYERGLMLQQTDYNKDQNIVKITTNKYTNTNDIAINAISTKSLLSCPFGGQVSEYSSAVSAFLIPMETIKLAKQIETNYDIYGNNPITKTTLYSYNQYQLPNSVTTTTGKSATDSVKVTTTYPFDNTTILYAKMKKKNMLNYPVETISSLNKHVTGGKITTYKEVINNTDTMYLPEKSYPLEITSSIPSFASFNGINMDNHYGIPNLQFVNYSTKGNLTGIIGRDNISTIYLWGYYEQYPIAEIKNASYSEVENATKSIFSVSSIEALSALSTPNESKLQDGSLQRALPNAQVKTFTYKPLIGISTKTDSRGVTTNYFYDDFGRLISSRDDDNRVLSQIKYNYSHLNYNTEQSGIFTRNNCAAGYVASQVTYTVPANKYSSTVSVDDANLKAQNDISTNGQNYANANGTCSLPTPVCTGVDSKLINGSCETGVKVYTKSVIWGDNPTTYNCTYHYEWSDGSRSPVNYSEISYDDCLSF